MIAYLINYHSCSHAVRCPNPAAVISNGNIIISNYGDPIEGTIITLSCLHGLILIGSNTSACMGNGNWEPDLKGIQCNGELISMITYVQFKITSHQSV